MKTMSISHMRLHFLPLLLLCCVSPSSLQIIPPFSFDSPVVGLVACPPHQIQALTEFKNKFDTNHCNHSDPFNGIWCDNSTGAITKLQLRSCLSGSLKPNSSLFRLHHLRYLDLSENNFIASSLPSEFGNLNRLEVLFLPSNGFIGQVPSSFGNLNRLSLLSLNNNELTGSFPLIRNLTKLVVLDLSHNHFSGTLNPNSSFFEFHHLRLLNLGYNNFNSSLPSQFGNLNRLESLYLSSNDFFGQVLPTISNLTSLTELYLDQNKLSGSFPLIRNLTKLVVLEISHNHFSGTLNPNSSLFELHHLCFLGLGYNNFGSSPIPSELGNLNRLEFLSLSSNDFFGLVPPTISNLTSLTKLYLDQNKLTGSFQLIRNLTKLEVLEISYNHFSGNLNPDSSLFELHHLSFLGLGYNNFNSSSIPSELGNLSRLEFLSLSSNDFFGLVPPTISNLTSLTKLYLDQNKLDSFPLIQNLTKLSHLSLSENRIKGKVPEWFWSLPRLESVWIGKNYFNGLEGPAEVLVNSSVKLLDLQQNCFEGALPIPPLSIAIFATKHNRFTGSIPLSICNCKSLTVLDLPYNNLTGPIPQCLSNLTHVILRKNNLEGSIPDVFNASASLLTLDVGYNRLTGKLPRSLVNCSSLQFLSVENNEIEDSFPFWLKALPNLQVLTLSSNKFFGHISPPDQGPLGFPELRIFEISDNGFTGSLPPNYFLSWKASTLMNEDGGLYMGTYGTSYYTYWNQIDLRYKGVSMENQRVFTFYAAIDFSGNRLEGNIPESIGLLKALIALNLSNNAFTGHIPLSFYNLTELESLDLSSNQLSGTIPNGLGSLSFLEYINVSHNQLKGEIPQGTQITGQPKSSFEGNAGLCGLPLQETCFGTNAPPTQQPMEENDEEEEEVLNWKGVVIAYGPGVLLGLAIAQVIVSYKPHWLAKIIGSIVFDL